MQKHVAGRRFTVRLLAVVLFSSVAALDTGAAPPAPTVDGIVEAYTSALGGKEAIGQIKTRSIELKARRGHESTVTWQAPDKVVRVTGKVRQGFDGHGGWTETKKKKILKLSHADEQEMLTQGNPIRFVNIRSMYSELKVDQDQNVDGQATHVVVAPNNIAATKFFFDSATHLLSRVEEFGDTSAYYKRVLEFSDYQSVDGIRLPFSITETSDEPGAGRIAWTVKNVKHNLTVEPGLFNKPSVGSVISGGKR
jgi:hypothetical protein